MFIVCIIGCAALAFCVGMICKTIIWQAQTSKIARQGFSGADTQASLSGTSPFAIRLSWLLRNGIPVLKKPSAWLIERFTFIKNIFDDFVFVLEEKKYVSDRVSALSAVLGLCAILAVVGSLLFRSWIAGVAIVLLMFVLFFTGVNAIIEKRTQKMREAVPEMLRSMESCFKSGYTLLQTFEFLANEQSDSVQAAALKTLFSKCANVLQTGGTIPQALAVLRAEKSIPELAFVSVALDVQHQSGGSMGPVIDAARDMVESRLDLLRKLSVQTAQAKLSARVVTIMPFALVAVFSIVSPDFLAPFFSSFLGIVVLAVACLMQAAGVICVRKMLNVEV